MNEEAVAAERYVLADCVETGMTKCFAKLRGRSEVSKDPFRPRKKIVHYYPRYGLRAIYTGDGADWSGLERSPFWKNPRLVALDKIPNGVEIP